MQRPAWQVNRLTSDVYISHSPDDEEWVDGWLLPRLEAAGLRVYVHYRDSQPGASRQSNIERGMKGSRRTVAVVTPAWLASEWNLFEDTLVRSLDPAALRRRLIPLKLKECELPESLAALESIDLTAERRWEQGIDRLRRDLEDIVPVPAPWRQDPGAPLWTRWRRWLRRYRREVRRGVATGTFAMLLLLLAVGLPPFQDRPGWQALSAEMPQTWRFERSGDVLLVSSMTDGTNVCRVTTRGFGAAQTRVRPGRPPLCPRSRSSGWIANVMWRRFQTSPRRRLRMAASMAPPGKQVCCAATTAA